MFRVGGGFLSFEEFVQKYSSEELDRILEEYGDEKYGDGSGGHGGYGAGNSAGVAGHSNGHNNGSAVAGNSSGHREEAQRALACYSEDVRRGLREYRGR
mgnify:CR=1 FL=1